MVLNEAGILWSWYFQVLVIVSNSHWDEAGIVSIVTVFSIKVASYFENENNLLFLNCSILFLEDIPIENLLANLIFLSPIFPETSIFSIYPW